MVLKPTRQNKLRNNGERVWRYWWISPWTKSFKVFHEISFLFLSKYQRWIARTKRERQMNGSFRVQASKKVYRYFKVISAWNIIKPISYCAAYFISHVPLANLTGFNFLFWFIANVSTLRFAVSFCPLHLMIFVPLMSDMFRFATDLNMITQLRSFQLSTASICFREKAA